MLEQRALRFLFFEERHAEPETRVFRVARHTATRVLTLNCSRCFHAVDSGDDYSKVVGLIGGEFYWYVTHLRCY